MKNYGEELVYWYFRLNGFIPMADFVLHTEQETGSSDCDLIAVRFPHVYENVGGQPDDWDDELLGMLGHNGHRTLGVFVQVKTGENGGNDFAGIEEYFRTHCEPVLNRIGFWPKNKVGALAEHLWANSGGGDDNYAFSKVAVMGRVPRRQNAPCWIELDLNRVITFIVTRMHKYGPDKDRDRMFFPDSIIQFLADRANNNGLDLRPKIVKR